MNATISADRRGEVDAGVQPASNGTVSAAGPASGYGQWVHAVLANLLGHACLPSVGGRIQRVRLVG